MQVSEFFAGRYAEARDKFRAAAAAANAETIAFVNPSRGPAGEELVTDTAWLGPRGATQVFVSVSGTHGAEGFCGSAVQVGWLQSGLARKLPPQTGWLAVHAINPYGFAWLRRVNEDNIDLNRNHVAHDDAYPENLGYERLKHAICPAEWTAEALARADAELQDYGRRQGAMALQAAISSGQYGHAEGVFYGGRAPAWSNRTLATLLARFASDARRVAVVDLHTGLGPFGVGEIINNHPAGTAGFARVRDWYGTEATSAEDGTSTSAPVTGDTTVGVERALPGAELTAITLEYGTRPLEEVLRAVRADNWLHLHGDLASALGREIKTMMREAFYPATPDWQRMVFERAVEVHGRALARLAAA
jgi:hypothetical protein